MRTLIAALLISALAGAQTFPSKNSGLGIGYSFPVATAGLTGYVTVPFTCTINQWSMTATTGTATIDVWKVAGSANALPTIANTITGSSTPAISSGTTANSTTLTGWATAVSAGDVIAFSITASSATGVQGLSLVLRCQ